MFSYSDAFFISWSEKQKAKAKSVKNIKEWKNVDVYDCPSSYKMYTLLYVYMLDN